MQASLEWRRQFCRYGLVPIFRGLVGATARSPSDALRHRRAVLRLYRSPPRPFTLGRLPTPTNGARSVAGGRNRTWRPRELAESTTLDRREVRRTSLVSLLGSTIEWYDFFIYGTAAALVLNTAVLPRAPTRSSARSPRSARSRSASSPGPIGGIIWGHFGDRIGRKKALVSALFVMGASTTLVGPAARLRDDRRGRTDPAVRAAHRAGTRRRAGSGAARSCIATEYAPAEPPRLLRQLPAARRPDRGDRLERDLPGPRGGSRRGGVRRVGLARAVPAVASCSSASPSTRSCSLEDTPAFKQIQQQEVQRRRRSPIIEVAALATRKQVAPGRRLVHRRERRLLHLHRLRAVLRHRRRSGCPSRRCSSGSSARAR